MVSTVGHRVKDALGAAGVTDCVVLDEPALERSVFDDATHTWMLSTNGDEAVRADIVITDRQVFVPWIPDIPGRGEFAGESFHAAAWDSAFDPTGKHIAVVGTDSAAGHYIGALLERARSVTAFAVPPRRFITELLLPRTRAMRWLSRRIPRRDEHPAARQVRAAIAAVTRSGIRTSDGVQHRADVIVYGTGYTAAADHMLLGSRGLSIQRAWTDGMEPFLGVAAHGFPNYFFLTGPDIDAQITYVVGCLQLMTRMGSPRIEVRRSTQQVFNERAQLTAARPLPVASAFDLSSGAPEREDDVYDGPAMLQIADTHCEVHVRLAGRLDPLDGKYHWQGTVFDRLPSETLKQARAATLSVGARSAPARIIEETPWGTHSVAGVGTPPFASPTG
ncbi:DUF4873 domain-containing protein [Mycobacterium intermedium]|uniref:DUF4873 domain-containing protein n=1 Tax=Mycobacterium intermedium TaxID=28445 RepID=A0A1E3SHH3_MYCIE|nr:DUF4873 domain-containing protein [Mycobacterium intermedium]OPE50312.1 DUF4873 domain-containing protein [Mycobacterium intermedium]ORA97703.1 DUF4873 domain-containing protein [Mycobacterium intermedium]